jgi:hypothetical protein
MAESTGVFEADAADDDELEGADEDVSVPPSGHH